MAMLAIRTRDRQYKLCRSQPAPASYQHRARERVLGRTPANSTLYSSFNFRLTFRGFRRAVTSQAQTRLKRALTTLSVDTHSLCESAAFVPKTSGGHVPAFTMRLGRLTTMTAGQAARAVRRAAETGFVRRRLKLVVVRSRTLRYRRTRYESYSSITACSDYQSFYRQARAFSMDLRS